MDIRRFSSALLPLVVLLQACSSTPFGQQLSESFDGQTAADVPTAAPSQPEPSQSQQAQATESKDDGSDRAAEQEPPKDPTISEPQQVSADQPVPTKDVQPADGQPADGQPAEARAVPERTRPYRIIIRLSAADPAAPAEGVTEALRRAGIGFEVETIEKVPARDLNPSPSAQPSSTQRQPAS
ncbi:hypothetical protein [Synechococcus sp. A15-60]|uniref:hypothetical protein n=1 Tax=Synechococcus sp. A15-60 TaxID=1050655 RepID=UPI0016483240|nr:hypothetical protein [Synechococcus sp. A15-60]QNI47658.1 hypothetical protein SynA1560_00991 [Synechococcus sp. A15-60]